MGIVSNRYIISHADLTPFQDSAGPGSFHTILKAFIRHQNQTWPELRAAYAALRQSLVRPLHLPHCEVRLQCNPGRMQSASAGVDKHSVRQRACFLCPESYYPKQKALPYRDAWLILNNPFPIFADHLVVSGAAHVPQRAADALGAMLAFVADSDGCFVTFYNGPACGASAPDHLHFQACPPGGIPFVEQLADAMDRRDASNWLTLASQGPDSIIATGFCDNRAFSAVRARDQATVHDGLASMLACLAATCGQSPEPKVNIIVAKAGSTFLGMMFPRRAHRPECYYRKDAAMLLVSPGAVDVGGLVILPRPADYEHMTGPLLLSIFSEVCCGPEILNDLSMVSGNVRSGC